MIVLLKLGLVYTVGSLTASLYSCLRLGRHFESSIAPLILASVLTHTLASSRSLPGPATLDLSFEKKLPKGFAPNLYALMILKLLVCVWGTFPDPPSPAGKIQKVEHAPNSGLQDSGALNCWIHPGRGSGGAFSWQSCPRKAEVTQEPR